MSNFAHRPQNGSINIAYQLRWEREYQDLLIKFLRAHKTFDGSEVSAWMRKKGLHDPEHHNMWGAQITYYAAQGWMRKLGRVAPMNKRSHLNQVQLWERA